MPATKTWTKGTRSAIHGPSSLASAATKVDRCISQTRIGKRCLRKVAPTKGRGEPNQLCRFHLAKANGEMASRTPGTRTDGMSNPDNLTGPTPLEMSKNGIATDIKKKVARRMAETAPSEEDWAAEAFRGNSFAGSKTRAVTNYVVNAQAKKALSKIGLDPSPGFDPKTALLATVESSWRQMKVFEAMLSSIPEDDWSHLGVVPIPGMPSTARGARIEVLQRFLGEATKNASRISKLAIDAGIEERLVRIAEEQSALIADTVRAGVLAALASLTGALRLPKETQELALEAALGAAAGKLRALASGDPLDEAGGTSEGVAVRVLERPIEEGELNAGK